MMDNFGFEGDSFELDEIKPANPVYVGDDMDVEDFKMYERDMYAGEAARFDDDNGKTLQLRVIDDAGPKKIIPYKPPKASGSKIAEAQVAQGSRIVDTQKASGSKIAGTQSEASGSKIAGQQN